MKIGPLVLRYCTAVGRKLAMKDIESKLFGHCLFRSIPWMWTISLLSEYIMIRSLKSLFVGFL